MFSISVFNIKNCSSQLPCNRAYPERNRILKKTALGHDLVLIEQAQDQPHRNLQSTRLLVPNQAIEAALLKQQKQQVVDLEQLQELTEHASEDATGQPERELVKLDAWKQPFSLSAQIRSL
jgi:hypothetical protein